MSYEDKGTVSPMVVVSREPDRSGNFICDGVADDIQIQAAIDYIGVFGRGTVFIKQGQYEITAPLVLTGIYAITIVGEGSGRALDYAGGAWVIEGTVLRLANGVDDHLIEMIEAAPSKLTAVRIRDLNLHGNGGNQTPGAASDIIHLEYVKEVIIERCQIMRGERYGISLTNSCENVVIINNNITQESTGSHCIYIQTCVTNRILNNKILGATGSNMRGIYVFNSSYRNIITNNAISDSYEGIRVERSSDNQIHNNEIFDITNIGIVLTDTCIDNIVSENRIDTITNNHGITITDYGTASENNKLINNVILSCGTDGIRLDNLSERTQVFENTLKDNGGYGININAATVINSWVKNNLFDTNASGCINDSGANTELHEILGEFNQYGGGSAGLIAPVINTSPGGIDIDANDEFAATRFTLPEETQQVVRVVIWAYTNVLEADAMRLRIVAHGATDNEAWSGNAIDVADHPSESTNFAANDVIYWVIDASDDAQVGTLAASDYVELMAVGEAAGGADAATDALLGGFEIHYV